MLVVGLTGGIGAGKSTVAQFFSELGALVIDADQLARMAIERGSDGFAEVQLEFGETVFTNGDIDRKKLAEVVFADESARKKLEAIIHPRVQALFAEAVSDLGSDDILVYEIPLLVETGAASKFDVVVTVEADLELRKKRLLDRGMYISQIEKRIASQATRQAREEIANFIVINDGEEDALLRSVEEIWEQLQARSAQNPGAH
jgi:dephospho-CoA kinase